MKNAKFALLIAGAAGLAMSAAANAQLTNGGFETGDFSGWTQPDNNPPAMVTNSFAHSGTYSALLGTPSGSEPLGDGSIAQRVMVNAGDTLSFWYKADTTDSISFDWQNCDILDSGGTTVLANVLHVCRTSDWTNVQYDMSAFAGQVVTIRFLVHQDGFGDDTDMYVDDVQVAVLPTGACCLPNGTCVTATSDGCASQTGDYRGDGTSCGTINCPSGACCLADGSCVTSTGPGCAAQNGMYRGDGTTCGAGCPTGACCTASGCFVYAELQCTSQGGTYHGDNSTCAQAGCPQAWTEQGDAGDLPASAQVVTGTGSLPGISGSFAAANDVDMYQIQICDAANFSANTVNSTTTGVDTQLFLFDSGGHGVTSDDDDPQGTGGTLSRLSSQFVPGNGLFYIAITAYNQDPYGADSGGLIWSSTPFGVERRPDGPAAAEAIGSWDTSSFYSTHAYLITFTGACFVGGNPPPTCYANCDHSTAIPFLNVNDFICFQTHFASGDSYANCDLSTTPPVLNVNDFICFQTKFAAGCSAP